MATKIRLKRIGRRNRPFYRLVIMDARNRRDGAAIEEVGWYNPIAKDEMYSLKEDRILHWLQEGAQPTDTAHDILRTAGLAHKWHLMKQGLDEAAVEKEMKKWALEREDVLERRRQRAEAKVAEKKAAEKAAVVDTATEADDKSESATVEAAVDEDPADVIKSKDKVEETAAEAPVEEAGDGATTESTEKEDESAETVAEDEVDEQEEESADADGDEEDKRTNEVEPQKDKSGKKGSKKKVKKNGKKTDE